MYMALLEKGRGESDKGRREIAMVAISTLLL
jgi:hypothetical protein